MRLIYESHQFFALNPIFFPADGKFDIYKKNYRLYFKAWVKKPFKLGANERQLLHLKANTTRKGKQPAKSVTSKNGYESMNRSPRVTFSRSLAKQFVRKTEGDYENDNFRVMVTAVDEYLTGKK